MAASFSQCFTEISDNLKEVYEAEQCIIIPGSGTYAMEAVAGQFPRFKSDPDYSPCLVVRNGYFSFRWTDIWDVVYPAECGRSPELIVMKAQPQDEESRKSYAPMALETVVAEIRDKKPCVVFMPHVETSAGIVVSDEYIKAVADATHETEGAILVLDCIASGTYWVGMRTLGVDVLVTAPQKGWSGPACCGIAMMSERAMGVMAAQNAVKPKGHSFSCNLHKWNAVANAYAKEGGFMYYTTLPTDALMTFRDCILETKGFGYALAMERATELGTAIRALLAEKGFKSVAAEGFKANTVVVAYMRDDNDKGIIGAFKQRGIQLAAGVPLKVDEDWEGPPPTFRIGLFGLDKLKDVPKTVQVFKEALDAICA